jgi:DNA-binding XRE family transcriptional regulator
VTRTEIILHWEKRKLKADLILAFKYMKVLREKVVTKGNGL